MRDGMAEEVAKPERSNNAVLRSLVKADWQQLESIVRGMVPGLDAGNVLSAERKKRREATGSARTGPRLVKVKHTEKRKRVLKGKLRLNQIFTSCSLRGAESNGLGTRKLKWGFVCKMSLHAPMARLVTFCIQIPI